MFLLVTGASGVGKSTVRQRLAESLPPNVEAVELATLGETPQWSLAWRHRMVERLVQRAQTLQEDGRHLLVCGDPVPPGEVISTPSGAGLALHVLLLHAAPEVQLARLTARGDSPEYFDRHVAFAEWMRRHVEDPSYRPDVVIQDGWQEMRWERWLERAGARGTFPPWSAQVIDTSVLDADTVAGEVSEWVRRMLARGD